MRSGFFALMLAVGTASGHAWAHEGHAHKIMGTVAALRDNHIEVTATDGKAAALTITDKTKIVRGKTALKPTDMHPGDRVVVTATETTGRDGKTEMVATQIRLGTAKTPRAKK